METAVTAGTKPVARDAKVAFTALRNMDEDSARSHLRVGRKKTHAISVGQNHTDFVAEVVPGRYVAIRFEGADLADLSNVNIHFGVEMESDANKLDVLREMLARMAARPSVAQQ